MSVSRWTRLGKRWRMVLGACTVALGVQAHGLLPVWSAGPPVPDAAALVLAPRQSVQWTIDSASPAPARTQHGESDIGPDGKIYLGAYGGVPVAGLTLDQARIAIEKHLARYLKQPRVSLQTLIEAEPTLGEPANATAIGRAAPQTEETPEASAPAITVTIPAPAAAPVLQVVQNEPQLDPQPALEEPLIVSPDPQPNGNWRTRESGATMDTAPAASAWRPLPGTPAAGARVVAAGFQPLPAPQPMPVGDQPEPPTDLKAYPKKMPPAEGNPEGVEPGIVTAEPAAMIHPMPAHPPTPHEHARVTLPPYVVDPPDVLLVESTQQIRDQPVRGQHLIRPDGTIGLGIYGSVYVAGLTLDGAREAIGQVLSKRIKDFDIRLLSVDVLAYNSKFYYVITDGGGFGESVTRFPITGNETVLDAISQISGLPAVASKKHIWVARVCPGQNGQQTLPVDWIGITQHGSTHTNYQIMPNDRVYVKAQKLITVDTALARFLSPVERVLGVTLLGSSTVNSIKNGNTNGNNNR